MDKEIRLNLILTVTHQKISRHTCPAAWIPPRICCSCNWPHAMRCQAPRQHLHLPLPATKASAVLHRLHLSPNTNQLFDFMQQKKTKTRVQTMC